MNEVSVAGALQVHDAKVYLEKRVDLFLNAMFIFLVSDPRPEKAGPEPEWSRMRWSRRFLSDAGAEALLKL